MGVNFHIVCFLKLIFQGEIKHFREFVKKTLSILIGRCPILIDNVLLGLCCFENRVLIFTAPKERKRLG
jgi:hypothetical protein